MTTRIASSFLTICALAAMLVVATSTVSPGMAWAAVSAVHTATTNPTYENPATGVIEDSAGASNVALGESMVKGATCESALIEKDVEGAMFVTLRFKLMDQISSMSFEVSSDNSSYATAVSQQVQMNVAENTADYRFQIPSETASIRCSMDVIPMGRAVIFFVSLSNIQEGNLASFVQSIVPGEGSADEMAAVAIAANSAGVQKDVSAALDAATSTSSSEGVQEFNAEGRAVTNSSSDAGGLDGGTIALIVGAGVAVLAVAGAVGYVVYVRPKRAKQNAAAVAASASGAACDSLAVADGNLDASRV